MADEAIIDAPKRRGGWPRGKPRQAKAALTPEDVVAAADRAAKPPSLMAKMKARPNWESDDFVGVGTDGVDRLNIPKDILLALHRDGVALQWVTRAVRGM